MSKIAHYRRAVWLQGGPTLEQRVRDSLAQCPTPADTKFGYRDDVAAQVTERTADVAYAVGCHISLYSEGRPATTVENGGEAVQNRNAPHGEEYLKTGIHLAIRGDHVAYLASGRTNDSQISNLLYHLFLKAGMQGAGIQFTLAAQPDLEAVRQIIRDGVKSLDLGMTTYATTVAAEVAAQPPQTPTQHVRRFLANFAEPILGADRSLEEIDAASKIQASVHMWFDGRTAGLLTGQLLGEIAESVYDEEDDQFRIVTMNDEVITRDKMLVKREVNVVSQFDALVWASSFAALVQSLEYWEASGVFET
ncbi:MAG TPA: hypothetical protein VGV07_17970 [Devosia sp.]|jgi:hypothetical protein|uniref:hypothetical protein n=1 Tax=Devosia sp. TaxID=1871048 RepID=UPI002DDCFEF4|nr:hypothetical protein [Devosia sp.]HEV2517146.1 hypothetical protein [Devosia sp.]